MNVIKRLFNKSLDTLPITKEQRNNIKQYIETGGGRFSTNIYNTAEYLEDYLYYLEYNHNNIDYNLANNYFANKFNSNNLGGCSAIRSGKYFFRNFDWGYNEDSTFIIRTNKTYNKFKSIGIASSANIINNNAKLEKYSYKYNILPFMMTDGINENGVCVSINIVPKDFGSTNQNAPNKEKMCVLMIPRYILDNAIDAESICLDIKNNFNWYSIPKYEVHFLVADANKTFAIEFINNETIVTQLTDYPFITNFHIYDTEIDNDEIDYNSISQYGQGVERYQHILNNYPFADLGDIKDELEYLLYTNAYKEISPLWLTEFTGKHEDIILTVQDAKNNPTKFNPILQLVREKYNTRTRNGETWQSCHSSIYDIENKTLMIGIQENPIKYKFELYNQYEII